MLRLGQTHEWKALRVSWASLDQELVPPAIQCVEALRVIDVIYEHAAVGAPIERDTQRLEALLAGSVPELEPG